MGRVKVWSGLALVASLVFLSSAQAAEKVKFATPLRIYPLHYLIAMAAQENELWKKENLDVEWVPFRGTADQTRAFAAGAVSIGLSTAVAIMQVRPRGLALQGVADLHRRNDFVVWASARTNIREPKDLKGAKIGVSMIGTLNWAYGKLIFRALGMEGDVKFVGAGGIPETIAMLKTGVLEASINSISVFINLREQGQVRPVLRIDEYLPRPWVDNVVTGRLEFVKSNPGVVRGIVRAVLSSADFIKKNRPWALNKMREISGYSEESAGIIYEELKFTEDGRIDRKGMENVRNFLIEYGLLKKEEASAVEELYTEEFIR